MIHIHQSQHLVDASCFGMKTEALTNETAVVECCDIQEEKLEEKWL